MAGRLARGRWVFSCLVVGTVSAVLAGVCVVPAAPPAEAAGRVPAASGAPSVSRVAAGPQDPPPPPEDTLVEAQASARASGQRVEVASLRTETETTWANPDGSQTTDFALSPVRVRRDGAWVPVNLALAPVAGGWRPKAGPVEVSVSGGGSGPVLALGEAGRGVAVSWPGGLPAAQVSGREAEFDLGNGAVLHVTATVDGAWLRVVLQDRPATAPVWRLPLALDGLDVEQSVDGSFVFTDSAGDAVFAIPAPRMWDAARGADGVPERLEPVSSRLVREGGQLLLELAPSQAFLADEATEFPVTVDPDITTEVGRVRDTWVQEGETAEMWSSPKLLTGLVSGNRSRSYVQFDSAPLNGAMIAKAELKLYNWFTGSCSPSPVNVRPVTQDWPAVMTWPNQPTISLNDAYLGTKSFAHGNSAAGCATDRYVAINVRSMVTEWTDEDGVMEVDHGMSVRSTEADSAKRHTFCSMNPGGAPDWPCTTNSRKPVLSVTYNKAPSTPSAQSTDPPRTCATGASAPPMPTSSPTLKATVADPDGGQVYGKFEVFKAADLSAPVATGTSAAVTSPGTASWKPSAGKLVNGTTYAWRVRSYDLSRHSLFTSWCEFTVTLPAPRLDPPSTLHSTGAELSWPAYVNPDEPITEYQVHRGTTAGFTPSAATKLASLPTSATGYTDTTAEPTAADDPLENGRTYFYLLAVKTAGGTLVSSPTQAAQLPKAGRTTEIITSGVSDTTLSAAQPATNLDSLGGQAAVEVGNNSPTFGTTRAVVGFADLSAVPGAARVLDADVGLWATGNVGSGASFNAHALTRGFDEATATWDRASAAAAWTSPGGDFEALAANTTPVQVAGTGAWVDFDLGGAVSGWLATPSSNHGLAVKTALEAVPAQRVSFASSEATNTAQRPRLVVTYLTKTSESTYYAPHTPQLMVPNQDEDVEVTITNTTSSTWNAADWILSYHWRLADGTEHSSPPDNQQPPTGVLTQDVSPGESLDVTRTVQPPVNAEGGQLRSEWVLAWELRNTTAGQWLSQVEPSIGPLAQFVTVEDPESDQLGLEDFYSYTGQPTGAGSSMLVNHYPGNAVWSYAPWSNPSRGVNTFLRLTYNSFDTSNSAMGYGWSLSASTLNRLGSPLAFGPTAAGQTLPGNVFFTDGDGTTHTFALNETTQQYEHPAGVHLFLENLTGSGDPTREWVMTAPDRTQFFFDDGGYQTATVDKNGNELTFGYQVRQSHNEPRKFLSSVTDPEARTTMRVDYYTKGQDYTYIDSTGARAAGTNLTDPDIIDQISAVTDISGRKTSFFYTEAGLLGEMVDADGDAAAKTFRFGYDPTQTNTNTKLLSVRDPRGNTTRLTYFASQPDPLNHWKVSRVTDRAAPAGVTNFAYTDVDGLAGGVISATVTDANAHASTYQMDGTGRPTDIVDAKSAVTRLGWDDDHNVVLLEEPAAAAGQPTAKTQWAYDKATGYPLVMIDPVANGATADPDPATTTKPHTRFGYQTSLGGHVADLATMTSPNGSTTPSTTDFTWNFGYDTVGNLVSVTDPEGVATTGVAGDFETTYAYDPAGNLIASTDANANATEYQDFDANGYPRRIIDAAGADTFSTYDTRGNVVSLTDANNNTSTYTYDVFGRPLETRVPKSDTETIITKAPVYDANDNVEKAFAPYINTEPAGGAAQWAYAYDNLDRLASGTEPKDDTGDPARVTAYTYDPVGNLTTVTEPKGSLTTGDPNDFVTTYRYDVIDQLERVTDAAGGATDYIYDDAANLAKVIDAKKTASPDPDDFTASYTYDLDHRRLSVTDADGGNPLRYTYDPDGRTVSVTDEALHETTFAYDMRDLLVRRTLPHDPTGPGPDVRVSEFSYDEVGNRTAVISPKGTATPAEPDDFTTRMVYDELGRVVSRLFPFNPADGEINTQEAADHIDYAYDKVGNLTQVSAPPSADNPSVRAETGLTHFDNGWVKTSTDPWEITTGYDYDAAGRQTERSVTPAGQAPGPATSRIMSWGYTPDGKLASRADSGVPAGRDVVLVDNSDSQNTTRTAAAGTEWDATTDAGSSKTFQGYNYLTHDPGTGTSVFTWELVIPKAGTYEVFTRHGAEATATNASYTVNHASGPATAVVDQTTGAGVWKSLGSFSFTRGTGKAVTVSDQANGIVAADAVKLVRAPGAGETDSESKTYAYGYDPNANLTTITDTSSGAALDSYEVGYTPRNQVASVVEKASGVTEKSTSYAYDPNGNLASLVHDAAAAATPDQHSAYAYGVRDLLTEVRVGVSASDLDPKVTAFGYGPRRLRQSQVKHNNNTVAFDYFADRLLKDQHETKVGGVDVARHQLTYTPNGHRASDTTRIMDADNPGAYLDFVRHYAYDPAERVRGVEKKTLAGAVLETESYLHDAAGNLESQTIENTTTDFVYDRNRLLSATTAGVARQNSWHRG